MGLVWKQSLRTYRHIALSEAACILAGGSESMSQAPYVVQMHVGERSLGNTEFEDSLAQGLTDLYVNLPMGNTAENLADQYNISRQEQDDWAVISQSRAEKSTQSGILKQEIVSITIPGKKPVVFEDLMNSSEVQLAKIRCQN